MLSKLPTPKRGLRAAFTLLEIMIALAILGLLVGLAVANLGGIFGEKQVEVAKLYVSSTLPLTFDTYRLSMGSYPSTSDGLQALMTAPSGAGSRWKGPYVKENTEWPPKDPWGEPYLYLFPGKHNPRSYDLWSKGPDKTDGTADDVGNWIEAAATEENK
jgi:general secretion pathway protein G